MVNHLEADSQNPTSPQRRGVWEKQVGIGAFNSKLAFVLSSHICGSEIAILARLPKS